MNFDTSKLLSREELIETFKERMEELQLFFDVQCNELMRYGKITFSLRPVFTDGKVMTNEEVNDMLTAFTKKGYYIWEEKSNRFANYVVSATKEE